MHEHEQEQSMNDLLEQYSGDNFTEGEIIKGLVISVDRDNAYVDVGYKQEIPISRRELAYPAPEDANDVVKKNDEIEVLIVRIGGENGLFLSKRRAEESAAWKKAEALHADKEIFTVKVTKAINGGLLVSMFGIRGFIPTSHVDTHYIRDLSEYVGKELAVQIIEIDPKKQRLILSHRLPLEAEQAKKRAEILANLQVGDRKHGVVKRLVSYGAFVDIGGVDGLVYISDIAWERVNNPADFLKVGQEVEVIVKSIEEDGNRIGLSIKDTTENPWFAKIAKYNCGDIVTGKIVKLTKFGAFLELEPHLDGLIHNSELADKHINRPEEVVKVGETVSAKIISINQEKHKIGLSIKAIKADEEQKDFEAYQKAQAEQTEKED